MLTMATPGQASVCFSCGQPVPRDLQPVPATPVLQQPAPVSPMGSDVPEVAAYPLTGAQEAKLEPPPNPYGGGATAASIIGAAGQFAIRSGIDVHVGRDPAQCPITLAEPRVSGVHATLRFDNGQLMVRDEGSNNGTYVNGSRIPAGVFTPVAAGAALRFGPIEFSVRLE
jgi:hypothetical protein